jgi:hypothetical protein
MTEQLTKMQMRFLRGVYKAHYPTLSATEAGDPELIELLDAKKFVDTYWGIGGTHLKLTPDGYAIIGMEQP